MTLDERMTKIVSGTVFAQQASVLKPKVPSYWPMSGFSIPD